MKILIITSVTGDTKGMYDINKAHLKQIKEAGAGLKIESVTNLQKNLDKKILDSDILISNDLSLLTPVNARNLKWVHITSAGTNKVPDFLKNSKIFITNSSGVHPIPISEHVFAMILMLSRNIHKAHRTQIVEKQWTRSYEELFPQELFGKKLLVVGMGRIGERIAEIAVIFGMDVEGVVRTPDKKRKTKVPLYGIKDLEKAVKDADFIVNCLPGTEHTKGIFNKKIIGKFKETAYFINIGRGTSVAEEDLIKALEKNKFVGAGLDVFETEPLSPASKLWNLKNVIITPHYSGWTPKYADRVIDIFTLNLKAYLRGAKMPNLVNKELGY
jgi:phosphoglycerate dehydrogenase-like enzyme